MGAWATPLGHDDEFQCGQCGDWLAPEHIVGHGYAEGRDLLTPGLREAAVTSLAIHLHRKGVGCDGHRGDDRPVADVMHRDDAYDIYDHLAALAAAPVDLERLAEAIHADDHPEQTPASEEACRRNDRAKAERLIALLAKK